MSNVLVRVAGLVGAAVALVGCAAGTSRTATVGGAATAKARPNVIVILADDLGNADIGVQGGSKDVRTPNIDSIAKEGVRFTQGYVSCPVCSPSRAGLLTGRYQQRFGYEQNPLGPKEEAYFGLPQDQVTIADEMRRAGYATGALGKWHLGDRQEFWPLRRGFDEFYGFIGGMHSYMNMPQGEREGLRGIFRGDQVVEEKEYFTDALAREAVSFIDRHKEQPFFLYVAYNAVHTPMQAPKKYQDRFPNEKDRKRKMMLAMLSAADDGVGRILGKLKEDGLDQNTLVVFLSDNGGPTSGNASRNSPFRGFKGQIWEGGIRVPFMARWPGLIPAGRVVEQPVISTDLFPTALAAAGEKVRDGVKLDGVNILPVMEGKTERRAHQTLYWRYLPQWAIRDGDWKLEQGRDGVTHLFDLAKDPYEKTDLIKDRPEVAKELKAKYDAWDKELMEPKWEGRQEGANDAAMVDHEDALADAD